MDDVVLCFFADGLQLALHVPEGNKTNITVYKEKIQPPHIYC